MRENNRYWMRRIPGWLIFAVPAILLAFLIQAALFGWQPLHGWGAVAIGIAFVFAYYWLTLRFPLFGANQYLDIGVNTLIVRTTWQSTIPFSEIAGVRQEQLGGRVDLLRTFHGLPRFVVGLVLPYELPSFVRRILIPTWNKPPNVLIEFRRPVRLGSIPFRWYRAIAFTIDDPESFVRALSDRLYSGN